MTNMNLLQAMGHIDPGLIAEAAPDTARRKHATKPWIKWASLAACLCLIIAIGAQVFPALITATTVVKPSKPSSDLAMVAKLPVIRLLDADEAFEVQVGYGDMTGVYQYATLEIHAPGFEITDAQGNVYKDQYARRIDDFANDKYKISSYDKIAESCYYEPFTLRYVGDGAKASGGISFWLTTLQHGEPSTSKEENIGPRAELVNVYYEIKNGIMILTTKRKQTTHSNSTQLQPVDTQDHSTEGEPTPEQTPEYSEIPLIFSDYSDYLLFASKGEIDVSKYPNADIWLQNHEWNVDAFVDFKELLDLPDETSKGRTEEIIIEKDNEYTYYVYTKDETNKLKTEYQITMKYDKSSSNKKAYHESIVHINSVSDMAEHTGSFVYTTASFDVLYYKTEVGYKFVILIDNNFSIGVHFEGDGLTQSQIAAQFGDVLTALVDEDDDVVNQTLTQLSDFVLNN